MTQDKEAAGSARARHVAIIMDGNGRWAAQRGLPREAGHRAGIEALRRVVRGAPDLGVEMLTVYAFSTENWRRPASEVSALMSLLVEFLESETPELAAEGVRLATIGDLSVLPQASQAALRRALANTAGGERLLLTLALNYGGRAEIVRAAKKLVRVVQDGRVSLADVDEPMFASLLDTHALPDPDLLIRASGEARLSNFLLWQSAYTELWVIDTFWPDFGVEHLQQALLAFASRDRRYGSHS